jgi:hypothetical protein
MRSGAEAERQEKLKWDALKQQRALQQLEFEKTSEGMKIKAAREKAEHEGEVKRFTRLMIAEMIEKEMLKAGYDIKTGVSEGNLALYVTGESVNRVSVYQFMHGSKIVKSMKSAGFKTVRFWNGHQITGIFTENYNLAK